jgi:hypothetical protein
MQMVFWAAWARRVKMMQLLTPRDISSRHDDRGFTRRKQSSMVYVSNTVLLSIVVAITVGETLMRSAVIFLVLLFWLLSLPSAASANPLSLYGPFDQRHNGARAGPPSSAAYGEALSGCGRGRYRDPENLRCKGPANLP